jgi:hypothetical protein
MGLGVTIDSSWGQKVIIPKFYLQYKNIFLKLSYFSFDEVLVVLRWDTDETLLGLGINTQTLVLVGARLCHSGVLIGS